MALDTSTPSPSITAAVIAYLQNAMAGSLGVTATNPAVWRSYSPDVALPYAIVSLGSEESYEFQSNDPELAGYWTSVIANGFVFASFVATSETQVLSLARECVRKCCDSVATLTCSDGTTLELRPMSSRDEPLTDTAPGSPTAFRRTVIMHYKQQFPV